MNFKEGRSWGDNTLIGNPDREGFLLYEALELKDWDYLAKALGYSEGCPVVLRLIEERGSEKMAHRYAEVIHWRSHLSNTLEASDNPKHSQWASELIDKQKRNPEEPLGPLHDEDWTPENYTSHIPGTITPLSFALPRAFIYFKQNFQGEGVFQGDGVLEALNIFDDIIHEDSQESSLENLPELTLHFLDKLAVKLDEPLPFLKFLLSIGKIGEDNCHTAMKEILITLQEKEIAPYLKAAYNNLSPEELIENKIYHPEHNSTYNP